MTGGGLQGLMAYGSQNVLLSGNPSMTYFYKVFKRYTHFFVENVANLMDGQNQLFFDQPIKIRSKIQRVADLVSDAYFTFQLPDIYSKYAGNRTSQYEFQWTEYVGPSLISSVAIFIGGQKIQEFDGSYLVASALVDYPTDTIGKWKTLVGQVTEVTNPANGLYAGGGVSGRYPTVVRNTAVPLDSQLNRPSIFGRTVRVPLPFWFTHEGSALPLLGLQYHEVEIQITLNPINSLYTVLDASGFRVAPGIQMLASQKAIASNIPDYGTVYDASANLNAFLVDVGVPTPGLSTWNLNPTLEITYVYLPESERNIFASTNLSYLVHQVTMYPFPTLYNRQVLDLETHNPIERLLFVNRRSDSMQFRNQLANFTNWTFPTTAPFLQGTNANSSSSSGQLLQYAQQDIIQTLRVMCDGNEIQEEKSIDYLNVVYPFRTTNGNPNRQIPIYSFALHSLGSQPSGSINASRIRVFQVEVNPYQLPPSTTYVYDLSIYVESINFVEITGGMGGLKYAL